MSSPCSLKLEALTALLGKEERDYNICLHKPERWIDWENALALMGKEVFVVKIESQSREPLFVSYSPTEEEALPLRYDDRMQFVLKRR